MQLQAAGSWHFMAIPEPLHSSPLQPSPAMPVSAAAWVALIRPRPQGGREWVGLIYVLDEADWSSSSGRLASTPGPDQAAAGRASWK
jgi:hypothetical protein